MTQTKDNLISLDTFDKIISIDVEKLQATFQVGIRIANLARELEPFGLALRNMGTTDKQSYETRRRRDILRPSTEFLAHVGSLARS